MFEQMMARSTLVLGEGSMYERLRRSGIKEFDADIAHAGLIYHDRAREAFMQVHREYLEIGQKHGLPMIAGTPTWRANTERVGRSQYSGRSVNRDATLAMQDLRATYGEGAAPIAIAGTIGPRGDGYLSEQAPPEQAAEAFHRPQIEELASAGVDVLFAKTLNAAREGIGIARAMAGTDLPYVLSFVARRDGTTLDGTRLDDLVKQIDDSVARPPSHFFINCTHPSVLRSALESNPHAATRIAGLEANTSAKTPEELEGLEELETEDPVKFGRNMWVMHQDLGLTYLGGCCGSSTEHISALAEECVRHNV
jgi:homocysteine S-methyltransferase